MLPWAPGQHPNTWVLFGAPGTTIWYFYYRGADGRKVARSTGPTFGDTPLSDTGRLNAVAVENWLLSLPLANQSRNHMLRTMSIVLKEAKRQKIVRENPIADVEGVEDAWSAGNE